jgi:hypothetical protein
LNSIIVMNNTQRNGEDVIEWPFLKLLTLFEEAVNKNNELEKRIEELERQIKLLQIAPFGQKRKTTFPPLTPYWPDTDTRSAKWIYKTTVNDGTTPVEYK